MQLGLVLRFVFACVVVPELIDVRFGLIASADPACAQYNG